MTDASRPEDPAAFRYAHSAELPALLDQLSVSNDESESLSGASLIVSTYQLGKLVAFRSHQGRMSMLLRTFDKAMGVTVDADRLTIGTRDQIWSLRNSAEHAQQLEPVGRHDACYIPRSSHVTGDIGVHEIAQADDELWITNTRFSCLCTLDDDYSFVPRWQPPFIKDVAVGDCCHLNGLAIADGQPKYVTVFAETNRPEGWRAHKVGGGCLIDVSSGETVARGFSMPHSPRVYDGRVWLLDSGTGRLVTVELGSGQVTTVAELPGFTRGLAFADGLAFVGLSQIRESSTFGDLPINERLKEHERKCGVWVIELTSGKTIGFIEFDRAVHEIFDVQILPGIRYPGIIGLQKDIIHSAFVIPQQ